MSKPLKLAPQDAARIFREMLSYRRLLQGDDEFCKMADIWEELSELDCVRIKYRRKGLSTKPTKAGVVAFDGNATLIVPEEMMFLSRAGQQLPNFTLAHEFAHLALGHHEMGAVVKNFQLFDSNGQNCNIPPTNEELQANFGATFFQCGIALLAKDADAVRLGYRAHTDIEYVRKSLRLVQSEDFTAALDRLDATPRVIL